MAQLRSPSSGTCTTTHRFLNEMKAEPLRDLLQRLWRPISVLTGPERRLPECATSARPSWG